MWENGKHLEVLVPMGAADLIKTALSGCYTMMQWVDPVTPMTQKCWPWHTVHTIKDPSPWMNTHTHRQHRLIYQGENQWADCFSIAQSQRFSSWCNFGHKLLLLLLLKKSLLVPFWSKLVSVWFVSVLNLRDCWCAAFLTNATSVVNQFLRAPLRRAFSL